MDKLTLLHLALDDLKKQGWVSFNLKDFAYDHHLPYADVIKDIPSKTSVLTLLLKKTAEQILSNSADGEETTKDQLLDLILQHLDALSPYRDSLRSLKETPLILNTLSVWRTIESICKAFMVKANLRPAGIMGHIKVQALTMIYLATFLTWLEDDTFGTETTLLFLDKRLREAENLSTYVNQFKVF